MSSILNFKIYLLTKSNSLRSYFNVEGKI